MSWRGSELAKLMELPLAKLRMGAIFWVNHGGFPSFFFSQCSVIACLLPAHWSHGPAWCDCPSQHGHGDFLFFFFSRCSVAVYMLHAYQLQGPVWYKCQQIYV